MSRQISKTRYEKNLRIGVRFNGNSFVLLDGSPLPKLHKDAVAELLLRPDVLENETDRARFTRDYVVRILEKDSHVFIGISPHLIGNPNANGLLRDPQEMGLQTDYWLIAVRLDEALSIRIRGDHEARLEKCKCMIPALGKKASSVNHVFTIVSEAYETKRLSHTGNVFDRVFTYVTPDDWRRLEDLRLTAISKVTTQPKNSEE